MPYNPDGTFSLVEEFGTGTGNDFEFPNKVGVNLDDIAESLDVAVLGPELAGNSDSGLLAAANNLSDVTNATTARNNLSVASRSQFEFISGIIQAPTNFDFRIIEQMPYDAIITSFIGKLSSGTLTATLKINATPVLGGVLSVTSAQSQSTPSGSTSVISSGNALILAVSAISSPVSFSWTVVYLRTLA